MTRQPPCPIQSPAPAAAGVCRHRAFRGRQGDDEHFFAVTAAGGLAFAEQVADIAARYAAGAAAAGLADTPAVFARLFLSDAVTQAGILCAGEAVRDSAACPVALSVVQQPPLPQAKVALLAYHIVSRQPVERERLSPHHVLVRKNGRRHLWSTRVGCRDADASCSSAAQTRQVFEELIRALGAQGGTLRDHCVRTWLYLQAIDVFYEGMVTARRELFRAHGLTPETHFIASSGIEGSAEHRRDIVTLDAYSLPDLQPRQVSYLNDFEMLCPTAAYNVTFERGTRIAYADRAQLFLSGTASIDKRGRVLHGGDVRRQFDRTLANVAALLRSGRATFNDLMYLIVYLRDPTDFGVIQAALAARLPAVPAVIVQGAVCRPGWLVEVEGVAIAAHDDPGLPSF